MPNQHINKVVYGNSTLIDLTSDTVTADKLMQGYTAHDASGAPIVGTATGGGGTGGVTQDANGYLVLDDDGGGSSVTVEPLSVTTNGTYTAPTGTAYSPVTVSVSGGSDTDFANTIMRSGAITSIPSSVTRIGDYAFRNCANLALTALPSGVRYIGDYAFRGCTNLALTELPSGVTSIGSSAFYNCTNLALTELPSGVTSIGSSAFSSCTNLALTELPSGVTSISSNAFYGCTNLAQIDLPSVGSIPATAFNGCSKLQTLVLRKSDAICTLANVTAFNNTPLRGYNDLTGTVYVPQALISTYQTATNWSTLYNEGHMTFEAIEGSEYDTD